jgi:hypothetical protein
MDNFSPHSDIYPGTAAVVMDLLPLGNTHVCTAQLAIPNQCLLYSSYVSSIKQVNFPPTYCSVDLEITHKTDQLHRRAIMTVYNQCSSVHLLCASDFLNSPPPPNN